MRKFGMIGLAAVAALALAGCKSTSNGNMGATSGACSKGDACCSKEKGAMGAVSGEKSCSQKSECSKGAMGAVSGQSSCSKTCTK